MILATVLMLAVHSMIWSGHRGPRDAQGESRVIQGLRRSGSELADDLRRTSPSKITIQTLSDGNHQVTLQMPCGVARGDVVWGVYDRSLGVDDASRTRPGWSVRYTVVPVPLPNGDLDRQLRRQLLDGTGDVTRQRTVLHWVRGGSGPKPGFQLKQNGSLYHVTLHASAGQADGTPARNLSFDVGTRN